MAVVNIRRSPFRSVSGANAPRGCRAMCPTLVHVFKRGATWLRDGGLHFEKGQLISTRQKRQPPNPSRGRSDSRAGCALGRRCLRLLAVDSSRFRCRTSSESGRGSKARGRCSRRAAARDLFTHCSIPSPQGECSLLLAWVRGGGRRRLETGPEPSTTFADERRRAVLELGRLRM